MAPGQIKINKYKRTEELGYRDCTSHGPETVVVDGGKRAYYSYYSRVVVIMMYDIIIYIYTLEGMNTTTS